MAQVVMSPLSKVDAGFCLFDSKALDRYKTA